MPNSAISWDARQLTPIVFERQIPFPRPHI